MARSSPALLACVTVMVLAGCGGSSSTAPTELPLQTAPAQPPVVQAPIFTGQSATIFVGGERGDIKEFDEAGHALSTAGSFPGVGLAAGLAYDRFLQRLYVVDFGNDQFAIRAFDRHGNPVKTVGSFPGLRFAPAGIVFDELNRRLYVTITGSDEHNSPPAVLVFDEEGRPVHVSGDFPGIKVPVGIAFNALNREFYIANNDRDQPIPGFVGIYDEDGMRLNLGCVFQISDVTIAPSVLAIDPPHERLWVGFTVSVLPFDLTTGNFLSFSSGPPHAGSISGITFDLHDRMLYVPDSSSTVMHVYDDRGEPVSSPGGFPGLYHPASVTAALQ